MAGMLCTNSEVVWKKKGNKVHAQLSFFFSQPIDMVKMVVLVVRWGNLMLLRFTFLL